MALGRGFSVLSTSLSNTAQNCSTIALQAESSAGHIAGPGPTLAATSSSGPDWQPVGLLLVIGMTARLLLRASIPHSPRPQ